jgi:hypothetical protein
MKFANEAIQTYQYEIIKNTILKFESRFMRIFGFMILGLVGLYFYLVEFGESTVTEIKCDGGFFIQVNEYSKLSKLYGANSEGNIKITYSNGTKEYLPEIRFIGEGNQKIALIHDRNSRWTRYIFGNSSIFEGSNATKCYG